tara:strand:+ start:384 stop:542 length:159 start_codon:yes stop_codon:yes gene_type:complete
MGRIKSFDLDMGGIEIEYWEPGEPPAGLFSLSTNGPPFAMPASYPELMPMSR